MSGIYIASKVKHAAIWQELRRFYPIISTWIDEAEEGQTNDWSDLWSRCISEAKNADVLIVYCEPGEMLKGAWVEVGVALASGVPVIGVGIHDYTISKSGKIIEAKDLPDAFELAQELINGKILR